jgi:putative transposase
MSHALAANFVHCVFSTKERRDRIPVELQEKLYAYLIGIADNLGFKILAAGELPTMYTCSLGCRLL